MLVNVVIGLVIFGYASYAMFKHVKNSKKGACSTCELQTSCSKKENDCCDSVPAQVYLKQK